MMSDDECGCGGTRADGGDGTGMDSGFSEAGSAQASRRCL